MWRWRLHGPQKRMCFIRTIEADGGAAERLAGMLGSLRWPIISRASLVFLCQNQEQSFFSQKNNIALNQIRKPQITTSWCIFDIAVRRRTTRHQKKSPFVLTDTFIKLHESLSHITKPSYWSLAFWCSPVLYRRQRKRGPVYLNWQDDTAGDHFLFMISNPLFQPLSTSWTWPSLGSITVVLSFIQRAGKRRSCRANLIQLPNSTLRLCSSSFTR